MVNEKNALWVCETDPNDIRKQWCMENTARQRSTMEKGFDTVHVVLTILAVIVVISFFVMLIRGMCNKTQNPQQEAAPAAHDAVYDISTVEEFVRVRQLGLPVLALCHAPWCGHCKMFKPHFEKAAQELHAEGNSRVTLAMVNCEEVKQLHQEVEIPGYPFCLQIWSNGAIETEQPPRNKEGVKALARKTAEKPVPTPPKKAA